MIIWADLHSWMRESKHSWPRQLRPEQRNILRKSLLSPLSSLLSQLSTTQARLKQSHFMIFTFKLWEESGNLMIFWNLWSRTLGRLAWEIKCNNGLYWSSRPQPRGSPPYQTTVTARQLLMSLWLLPHSIGKMKIFTNYLYFSFETKSIFYRLVNRWQLNLNLQSPQ